jgi:hypothetical protein
LDSKRGETDGILNSSTCHVKKGPDHTVKQPEKDSGPQNSTPAQIKLLKQFIIIRKIMFFEFSYTSSFSVSSGEGEKHSPFTNTSSSKGSAALLGSNSSHIGILRRFRITGKINIYHSFGS